MDIIAVAGFGAAAAGFAVLGAHVARNGRAQAHDDATRRIYIAALLTTSVWAALEAGASLFDDLAWPGGAALLDIGRQAAWLAFLLASLHASASGPRDETGARGTARPLPLASLLLTGCIVLMALGFQSWRVLLGEVDLPPSRIGLASLLALPLTGAVLLEQLYRNLSDDSRWKLKPIALGLAVIFAFDIYMLSQALMFGRFDSEALHARGTVNLVALPALLVGAQRRGQWQRRLEVSRSAVFHSAALVFAGAYLLVLSALGYYVRWFGGSWGGALQLVLIFGAAAFLVAIIVSGALRARLRVFVGKHFFSHRFDYREQWLRFTSTLAGGGSPQQVGRLVIRGLADMVECPAGSLWTRVDPSGPYRQTARWNVPAIEQHEAPDTPFARYLRSPGWIVDLDEWRADPKRYDGLALPQWLAPGPNAWLVLPLQAGDSLLGFVVLARPRTEFDLNWEALDLLKAASRQAAIHLAQMQATEALLEARKFDAFNRMSAFVVHDLKNIVTQLSLMLKNAERHRDNREFQQDMLLTVESSLEKMRRLMLQLREGGAPPGGASGVEIAPIVSRLEALAQAQGRRLEVARLEALSTRGHDDRLERVLGHLVQNALDATPASGRVWLEVTRASGQVRIEIGDTGSGMSEEFVQTRLFIKPFSSTKGSGMGVGAFESSQYVRELGGSIRVADTAPGRGTRIEVLLPLFESRSSADLLRADAA